jgi:hypothetical protein
MKINESRYIGQSVVLGQDQRYLGALIVVNRDEVSAWARENGIKEANFGSILQNPLVKKLFESEIAELVSAHNGYRLFERIHRFVLLEKPFETGVELSAKQEIMRFKLDELYKKEIRSLFGFKHPDRTDTIPFFANRHSRESFCPGALRSGYHPDFACFPYSAEDDSPVCPKKSECPGSACA